MELFITEETKVMPHPTTRLIKPFDEILEKNGEKMALLLFAYIEFMCSYKKSNPFIGYKEEERAIKILERLPLLTQELIDSNPIEEAMEVYKDFQYKASPTLRYYESTLMAANNMSNHLRKINLEKKNPKGFLLYKPADITRAIKDTDDVIKTLTSMRSRVIKELDEEAKGKTGREINHFEKVKES